MSLVTKLIAAACLVALAALYCVVAIGVLIGAARAQPVSSDWWSTPAVRACCSDADAVYADDWTLLPDGSVRAVVTGGGPRNHSWAPVGRAYIVPPNKILREPGNPTGRALLFLTPPSNAHVFGKNSLDLWCFAMGPLI